MAGGSLEPGRSVVSKFSAILMTFRSGGAHSLSEIAALSNLPISTAHRIVTDLTDWLVLERDPDGRTYRPGAVLRSIAATGCAAHRDLRDRAAPWLDDLHRATGAEVRLGTLDVLCVRYIRKGSRGPVSRFTDAATLPLHATAMGKVLLAYTRDREVEPILARPLPSFTPRTIVDRDQLRWILKRTRMNGLATADRELRADSRAIAAPVFGPGGTISAALEIEVGDLTAGLDSSWPVLAVAAASLSRELDRQCAACPAGTGPGVHEKSVPSGGRHTLDDPRRFRLHAT